MFDVWKPVSPMLQFIEVQDGKAIYHKIVYLEECDDFKVVEVLKYDVETWEKIED